MNITHRTESSIRRRTGRRIALAALAATMVAGVTAGTAHADRSPRPPAPVPAPVVLAATPSTVPPTPAPTPAPAPTPVPAPGPMVIAAAPVVEPTPTVPPVLAPAPDTVPGPVVLGTPAPAPAPSVPPVLAPAPAQPADQIPAGPGALSIPVTDSGYTIGAVSVTPHGTWAKLRWATNAPKSTLWVLDEQPELVNGVWTHWSKQFAGLEHIDTTGNVTFTERLLNPHTTYWYIITAVTSGFDKPVQRVGSFTTLTRTVTVHVSGIHVTSDGDPGAKGAGDFTFWFLENGKQWSTFSKDIKSDHSFGMDLTKVYTDVRANQDMRWDVQVFEDDRQSWDTFCGEGVLPGQQWSGKGVSVDNACGTWLTMGFSFDASPGIYGPGNGEFETQPIEYTLAPWKSSIHMTISVSIVSSFA